MCLCVCTHREIVSSWTATHCSTLQHTATRCNTLQNTTHREIVSSCTATHCNTLQHTHMYTQGDCFILDSGTKLYMFRGESSSPFEKNKAVTVAKGPFVLISFFFQRHPELQWLSYNIYPRYAFLHARWWWCIVMGKKQIYYCHAV